MDARVYGDILPSPPFLAMWVVLRAVSTACTIATSASSRTYAAA